MKLTKNSNILLLSLSLILSLVSFTGVTSHLPSEAIKTALVVGDYSEDTRFSIQYQNAGTDTVIPFSKYLGYSFTSFQNSYNLKEVTTFITYTHHTLSLRAEQLHYKLYALSEHQTLYNCIA